MIAAIRNRDSDMKSIQFTLLALLTSLVTLGIHSQAGAASALVTVDTVPVGNTGNTADPATGYGAVGYDYYIGKYEVTLNQYTAFLNAVGATDTYGLYNDQMGLNPNIMGIARSGVSGSYTYSVMGSGSRPVTYVSWFDAARFANWLHNGQPTGIQAAATTETGAYTLNGAMSGIITRNSDCRYGLPSESEWYKAAYYQPVELGGDSDNYWRYPTRSNELPNSRNGSTSDPNSANFRRDDGIDNGFNGGWAVNNSPTPPSGNALTDAGAFSLATSYYGTFDQGGNVSEWDEAIIESVESERGIRGGSWSFPFPISLDASTRYRATPTTERHDIGFRIVIIPEPSVSMVVALGSALLALRRRQAGQHGS